MIAELLLAAEIVLSDPVVIDSDTVRDGQVRYRIANLDAPERGDRARCPAERAMADAATRAMRSLLREARRVEAAPVGRLDRYGRVVAYLSVDGADAGEALIARGLARSWRGRPSNFCAG